MNEKIKAFNANMRPPNLKLIKLKLNFLFIPHTPTYLHDNKSFAKTTCIVLSLVVRQTIIA